MQTTQVKSNQTPVPYQFAANNDHCGSGHHTVTSETLRRSDNILILRWSSASDSITASRNSSRAENRAHACGSTCRTLSSRPYHSFWWSHDHLFNLVSEAFSRVHGQLGSLHTPSNGLNESLRGGGPTRFWGKRLLRFLTSFSASERTSQINFHVLWSLPSDNISYRGGTVSRCGAWIRADSVQNGPFSDRMTLQHEIKIGGLGSWIRHNTLPPLSREFITLFPLFRCTETNKITCCDLIGLVLDLRRHSGSVGDHQIGAAVGHTESRVTVVRQAGVLVARRRQSSHDRRLSHFVREDDADATTLVARICWKHRLIAFVALLRCSWTERHRYQLACRTGFWQTNHEKTHNLRFWYRCRRCCHSQHCPSSFRCWPSRYCGCRETWVWPGSERPLPPPPARWKAAQGRRAVDPEGRSPDSPLHPCPESWAHRQLQRELASVSLATWLWLERVSSTKKSYSQWWVLVRPGPAHLPGRTWPQRCIPGQFLGKSRRIPR